MPRQRATPRDHDRSIIQEASGACGDLGTFIPHAIGAMTVAGLAPVGVLLGFGVFLISTGLFYGLPLPVQPMKAVSAVILTDGLKPGEVAAASWCTQPSCAASPLSEDQTEAISNRDLY